MSRNPRGHRGGRQGAQKGSQSRSAPLWSGLLLFGCVALLGLALGGLFRVRHVKVVGAIAASDAVAQTAGVVGQNVFSVQSDHVVTRLSSMREFDVQRVETTFPDKVTIYVRPRRRFLAWQVGKQLYEVDANGRIIAQVGNTDLPVITSAPGATTLDSGTVQAARYATESWPRQANGNIGSFEMDPKVGLVIQAKAGWTAVIGRGSPETLIQRIAELDAVLEQPRVQTHHLQSADLRYPSPAVRFVGA